MKTLFIILTLLLTGRLWAGTLTVVHSFGTPLGNLGVEPVAGLVAGPDGTLYGTTSEGGTYGYGVVYELTTNGVSLALWNFGNGTDGAFSATIPTK